MVEVYGHVEHIKNTKHSGKALEIEIELGRDTMKRIRAFQAMCSTTEGGDGLQVLTYAIEDGTTNEEDKTVEHASLTSCSGSTA